MTKRDLIDLLKDFPDDEEVLIAYDYGDRSRSMVTEKITEVMKHPVRRSPYGPMEQCLDMDPERDTCDGDPIIIRG